LLGIEGGGMKESGKSPRSRGRKPSHRNRGSDANKVCRKNLPTQSKDQKAPADDVGNIANSNDVEAQKNDPQFQDKTETTGLWNKRGTMPTLIGSLTKRTINADHKRGPDSCVYFNTGRGNQSNPCFAREKRPMRRKPTATPSI